MIDEFVPSVEESLFLIAVLLPVLIWLIRKPINFEIRVPEVPEVEEKQPERNLRYLQIKKYYGG